MKAVNRCVLTKKIRLLILLFLLNVFLTSPRRTRKKSMKSSVRKDLKEIKEDISQLAADHERMLARLKSLKNDKSGSGVGSGGEFEYPSAFGEGGSSEEGLVLIDDMWTGRPGSSKEGLLMTCGWIESTLKRTLSNLGRKKAERK